MGFARSRPLLGTFVTVTCEAGADAVTSVEARAMTAAFFEAERLQAMFSRQDPASVLNRYNLDPFGEKWPGEFLRVVADARTLQQASEGFFNPGSEGALDLAGIAKGAIVDSMASVLMRGSPTFCGTINAGGDLRFLGAIERKVSVRVGPPGAPLLREMILRAPHVAFASSSPGLSLSDEKSSTRYYLPLADGLTSAHTACVAARACWTADALTKVGLHAPAEVADRVAREYEAVIVLFDARGEIASVRGTL